MTVKIIKTETKINVSSPYNKNLPSDAKNIGGKWNAENKYWSFDLRDESAVRQLYINVYGTDGTAATGDLVDIEVIYDDLESSAFGDDDMVLDGMMIAHRPGRDYAVRLSQNVILKSGQFPASGGSMKNPALNGHDEDIILIVRDIPRLKAEKIKKAYSGITIISQEIDKAKLLAEKAILIKRISEIDTILQ